MGMKFKKCLKHVAVYAAVLVFLSTQNPGFAVMHDAKDISQYAFFDIQTSGFSEDRASESFRVRLDGKSQAKASSSFSMAENESVSINASFFPTSADLDIGLIDSSGSFHYFSVTGGTVNKTILIPENGSYTLGIRNNSSGEVEISGYVKY